MSEQSPPSAGRAVLVYNACRLGLLILVSGVVYAAGLRNVFAALLVGLLVSGVASYFLLYRQRVAVAQAVQRAVDRQRGRYRAKVAAEDAADEQARRQGRPGGP